MPTQSIRLGTRHGYRTDGDFVHLNAELSDIPDTSANWALRLVERMPYGVTGASCS